MDTKKLEELIIEEIQYSLGRGLPNEGPALHEGIFVILSTLDEDIDPIDITDIQTMDVSDTEVGIEFTVSKPISIEKCRVSMRVNPKELSEAAEIKHEFIILDNNIKLIYV